MKVLGKTELASRASRLKKSLSDVSDEQAAEILLRCGIFKRLGYKVVYDEAFDEEVGGQPVYVPEPEPEPQIETAADPEPPEYRDPTFEEQVEAHLRERVLSNDPAWYKAWKEQLAAEKASSYFERSIIYRITDYQIADKSLSRIVMDADEPVVKEIITAFVDRCREDKCPGPMVTRMRHLLEDWLEWAKEGLKARKSGESA